MGRSYNATMTTYFTDKSFRFLRALARNNERAWFQAHKADYETHVRLVVGLVRLEPRALVVARQCAQEPEALVGEVRGHGLR